MSTTRLPPSLLLCLFASVSERSWTHGLGYGWIAEKYGRTCIPTKQHATFAIGPLVSSTMSGSGLATTTCVALHKSHFELAL
ncbi:hypothetical protein BD626DRAFT_512015 [Schizophyllum amplum]|uniref:Secreted protein n=1 Tax=Schizophyllum amplum TaxID=97359 RepID=A0A550C0E2_9AGAR|nr:hypothetical protein BD626DRAFT_512015 [Auriculariopsis ampla]